jgi:hypothetical protein
LVNPCRDFIDASGGRVADGHPQTSYGFIS